MNSKVSTLCILITLVYCFISCSKDNPKPFDLRNSFIGSYSCNVIRQDVNTDTWEATIDEFQDTLIILKNVDSAMIEIIGGPSTSIIGKLNFSDSTFNGYHLSGKFFYDSIYLYYYISPVALHSYTYRGKKIIE